MANVCGRLRATLLQVSTRNAVSKLCVSNPSPSSFSAGGGASRFVGLAPAANPKSASPSSLRGLFSSSRLPVELGCAMSLMPLHSATASALFNSLLSVHSQSWGILSEGFATPL